MSHKSSFIILDNMVVNHEITIICDFSRFLFATLTFWVVKSRRGSNGPVYPEVRLLRMLPGPKDPRVA